MLFLETMKTVVELAEFCAGDDKERTAVSIVKEWFERDTPGKIATLTGPVTVIFHPDGNIEFTGVTANEIVIDDRR